MELLGKQPRRDSDPAERRKLAAAVLMDLASNIDGGVSQLRRTDSGLVFIVGGIDEDDLV